MLEIEALLDMIAEEKVPEVIVQRLKIPQNGIHVYLQQRYRLFGCMQCAAVNGTLHLIIIEHQICQFFILLHPFGSCMIGLLKSRAFNPGIYIYFDYRKVSPTDAPSSRSVGACVKKRIKFPPLGDNSAIAIRILSHCRVPGVHGD
jgi:hypothetical protein